VFSSHCVFIFQLILIFYFSFIWINKCCNCFSFSERQPCCRV